MEGEQGMSGSFILWIPQVLPVKMQDLVQLVAIGFS